MDFALKPLPYAYDALEPHVHAVTVETHYEKHHRGYVEKLERLIADQPLAARSLEQLILEASGPVYANGAQVWNHDFYWRSLCPAQDRSEKPKRGLLSARIDGAFGSTEALWWRLAETAEHLFGSGYVWLVWQPRAQRLEIAGLPDADNPLRSGDVPLLCIDVWEHAYYLDRRNRRDQYVEAVLRNLLDWDAAEQRLRAAL